MEGSVVSNWIHWLGNYKGNEIECARRLQNELQNVDSVESALVVLSEFLKLKRIFNIPFFSDKAFFTQLEKWHQDLSQTEQNILTARQKLALLSPLETHAQSVLSLIRRILENPQVGLHCRINSLLNKINNRSLEEIFTHLNTLVPDYSTSGRDGDFSTVLALDETHAVCLGLLQSNANAIQKGMYESSTCETANSILQALLVIYKDLPAWVKQLEKSIEPSDNPKESGGYFSSCVIL